MGYLIALGAGADFFTPPAAELPASPSTFFFFDTAGVGSGSSLAFLLLANLASLACLFFSTMSSVCEVGMPKATAMSCLTIQGLPIAASR